MAGFPFDWIEATAQPSLAALFAACQDARSAFERLVQKTEDPQLLDRVRTKEDGRALRAARSRNYSTARDCGASAGVSALIDTIAKADAAARQCDERLKNSYAETLTDSRAAVVKLFQQHSELRDALFVLNPASFHVWDSWLNKLEQNPSRWTKKDRAKIDPLVLYLQRCCAKNDTTGHIGPFAIGQFDDALTGVSGHEVPQHRRAYLARWAAQATLDHLLDNPRALAYAQPRRAPGVSLRGIRVENLEYSYRNRTHQIAEAIGPRTHHLDLTPLQLRLLAACSGDSRIADLHRDLEEAPGNTGPVTREELEEALRSLHEKRLVVLGPELSYGTDSSLPLLRAIASECDDRPVLRLLSTADAALSRLPCAGLDERVRIMDDLSLCLNEAVGVNATRRGEQQFYGDRAAIFEESEGRVGDLHLGKETTQYVERHVDLITDAYLLLPRSRLHMERQVLGQWFSKRFGKRSVPLNSYLSAFVDDEPRLQAYFDEADRHISALQEKLLSAMLKDTAARSSTSPGANTALGDLVSRHGMNMAAVCNVDLMLSARPDAQGLSTLAGAVVSEVHADEEGLNHSIFGPYISRDFPAFPAQVVAHYQQLLKPGQIALNASLHHRNKGFIRQELPCREVEAFDRSPLPASMRLRMEDFDVTLQSGQPCLIERTTGNEAFLIALPFAWLRLPRNPMHVFGFPQRQDGRLFRLQIGQNIPRIVYDQNLVLSRATWRTDSRQLQASSAHESFMRVQRLRSQLGLPRHVFVSLPEEGKPVYVDLDSPLLVRQLCRLAKKSNSLTLTEMSPEPSHLWLRTERHLFTSEIRFSVFDSACARVPSTVVQDAEA